MRNLHVVAANMDSADCR